MSQNELEEQPRPEHPCGFGPVLTADDGTRFQVTEDDVRNALPLTSAFIVVMVTLDFTRHAEWTLGETHYYFGSGFRTLAKIVGFTVAGLIVLAAWRDVKRQEREACEAENFRGTSAASLHGRDFVPGKRPGWDE